MANKMSISRRGFLVLPLALAACKFDRRIFEFTGTTMGTYYQVTAVDVPDPVQQAEIKDGIETAFASVIRQLSNWDPKSEISRFNANQTTNSVAMSPMLAEVMSAAAAVHQQSLGRFDTTITPLIEAWGFGATGAQHKKPSQEKIRHALANSGHHNTLDQSTNTLKKKKPEAQVFLSAIGKGFGTDVVARMLESKGVKNYLIEIGGDIYAKGRNENGQPWQVGVETPRTSGSGIMEVVGLSNLGMASSGDYRNYFEQDGKRYSHVIDPTTGEPIKHHTASATVLAENGMLADAWATAMLTLGREEGLKVADANNIAVMFIDRDYSNATERFKVTTNKRFKSLQI
ncbi:MAG: FAD:protein FMN transferase [Pseudomonadota bacterium]